MANPQSENGHIRIANELWNEILRRDFSKRQQKLILFIWRLSYGTRQKDCHIPKLNMMELAGMYKQDVKKELNFLKQCKVLNWDEKNMIFSINKDYHFWQITPNKNWDNEKFNELIKVNLKRKKVSKTLTGDKDEKKKPVSKTLTYKSEKVSTLLTSGFVKHLLPSRLIPSAARFSGPLYTGLYTSITDTKRKEEEEAQKNDASNTIDLLMKNGIIGPGGITFTLQQDLEDIEHNFGFDNPDEMIQEAIKDAVRGNGRTWKFVYNKLFGWEKRGIKNLTDLSNADNTVPFPKRNNQDESKAAIERYRQKLKEEGKIND